MRKTEFLKLHLPDENEYYNVELDQNQNFIMVDEKLKEHSTALTTIQRGATNEQKGIVQFGIEEGKALEGNMLARLAGAYGFGGDIQNPGVKNQNYIYYDNNTRKMYKCLNQNSDTSANVQNYVPIDNFSFLDRLENFSKFEEYVYNIPKLTFGRITKTAGWITLTIDSGQAFFYKDHTTVLVIPEGFRPKKSVYFSASYLNSNKSTTFRLDSNGDLVKTGSDDNLGAYYFSVTYSIN